MAAAALKKNVSTAPLKGGREEGGGLEKEKGRREASSPRVGEILGESQELSLCRRKDLRLDRLFISYVLWVNETNKFLLYD